MKIALITALLLLQGDYVSEITHKNGKVTGIRPEGGYSIEAGN